MVKYQLHQCLGFRVRKLSRIIDNVYRSKLKAFGISENQLTILFALHQNGLLEQGKLGEMLGLERSSISRSIRLMVKNDWVKRSSDYRPLLELTKTGQEFVKVLIPVWEEAMDQLTEQFSNQGVEWLSKLEQKMI
ncbi:MarR family transcriptional regulator [Muricauda sp. JGD-17]|uniref:MarR family transcriptional regulator n=1 Tax=Flagellimonas ochracea TaxID=2696472 RepID=A0A964WX65_9FLAO|nr:MarR family transcriptional regulator [Allomuricauda ochracea]NAY91735.1 MarR family transcriptional regulator [Allomuricauda ochracea]